MKKKKRITKSCFFISEGDGISCNGYRKKETALKAMLELWNEDKDFNEQEYGKRAIILENIDEEKGVWCSQCNYFTIRDEGFCDECGETKRHRMTMFTIYFNLKTAL